VWPSLERAVRYMRAAYVDARLLVSGKRERDIPPLRLRFVGSGDFRAVGEHLLALTKTRGSVDAGSRVLDIGCGSGRLALPLTKFLLRGEYRGFDVVGGAIRWCEGNISREHPRFHFTRVSLRNSLYSARGGAASQFTFPYEDSQFDCVVAFSVFTHLLFEETHNYLRESYRVLAPGGRMVSTFFLLNEKSKAAQKAIHQVEQFPYDQGAVHFASKSNPALAVAIEENDLRQMLREVGFQQISVEPGFWYGEQNAPEFQDLVVCVKQRLAGRT
jgi:ubiquinone/menaquinone biosynthesis C-methylase UbiE